MPKNNVNDPITDQEIAFACLLLSGTMNDRRAAEAVGLHPDSAAYTKSKPCVRAYMLEHPAAVQQPLVEQDTHLSRPSRPAVEQAVEEQRRLSPGRDQILARLWEIANLDPERTRGSVSAQVKALSMIVAIEGLIPDRRAVSSQSQSAPPPVKSKIYASAWLTKQHQQPQQPPAQEEAAPDLSSRLSPHAVEPERLAPAGRGSVVEEPAVPLRPIPDPAVDLSESNFPGPLNPSQTASSPHRPMSFVPDARNHFAPRR